VCDSRHLAPDLRFCAHSGLIEDSRRGMSFSPVDEDPGDS
jgi:hypothetical protein